MSDGPRIVVVDRATGKVLRHSDAFKGARRAVLEILRMNPERWFRVQDICLILENRYAETGISSYCRELRKEKYGAHDIRCEKVPGTDRTYAYAWFPPAPPAEQQELGFVAASSAASGHSERVGE